MSTVLHPCVHLSRRATQHRSSQQVTSRTHTHSVVVLHVGALLPKHYMLVLHPQDMIRSGRLSDDEDIGASSGTQVVAGARVNVRKSADLPFESCPRVGLG